MRSNRPEIDLLEMADIFLSLVIPIMLSIGLCYAVYLAATEKPKEHNIEHRAEP